MRRPFRDDGSMIIAKRTVYLPENFNLMKTESENVRRNTAFAPLRLELLMLILYYCCIVVAFRRMTVLSLSLLYLCSRLNT